MNSLRRPRDSWIRRRSNSGSCSWVRIYIVVLPRAGHATTLSRQGDHVFRPKNEVYCIIALFVVFTPFRQQGLNIFEFFFVIEGLTCCRRREAKLVSRAQLCSYPSQGYQDKVACKEWKLQDKLWKVNSVLCQESREKRKIIGDYLSSGS